ncbi:MAG: hypothetical protein ACRCV9_13400 [Burkholderiaceae bacterium]
MNERLLLRLALTSGAALLAACQNPAPANPAAAAAAPAVAAAPAAPAQATPKAPAPNGPVPARMDEANTSAACVAQLQEEIAKLSGRAVKLTKTPFAQSDVFNVPRATNLPAAQVPGPPRRPDTVRLAQTGATCVLVHDASAKTAELDRCGCYSVR